MIVVIADDLTGATELAGAALDYGLTAEVQTRFDPQSRADVVALDTDTRWRTELEAARIVNAAARDAFKARPVWLYKKTDSVLRGNVRSEIESIIHAGGFTRALLVPANPSRGRVVREGHYFVQGVPLDGTAFARDPEHPRHTSRVAELVGETELIRVPDAAFAVDLTAHAMSLDPATLPAGGVDFFTALLTERCSTQPVELKRGRDKNHEPSPTLFVCGSAAAWQQGRDTLCDHLGISCLTMPASLTQLADDPDAVSQWAKVVCGKFHEHTAVMIAIGSTHLEPGGPAPRTLAARLADVASDVAGTLGKLRLCAEGGTTARAVIDHLGWTRLEVLRQWAPGVVELRSTGRTRLTVICKVGSYDWPEDLLATAAVQRRPFDEPVAVPIDGVLDLHTYQPEDLGTLIPEYLDQCRARGILEVRIIHGKGIGNLKRSVAALLKHLPAVESFSDAGARFGGSGATIVRLRKHAAAL